MSAKEAKARIKINKLLEEAGWRFLDEGKKPANIQVEPNVKIKRHEINEFGEDFEKATNGFVDFLLLDENGKPFIVLEAKSEDKDPFIGKEQAREYAKSLYVKYIILSNGNIHYFWNIEKGNPQIITGFPSYESLRDSKAFTSDPSKLYSEEVKSDYIAVSQMPRYAEDPRYIDENLRADFFKDTGLRFLRKYQIKAVKALQKETKQGKKRFLFEMATGTGKTMTSAAIIKLFLRTGSANRVLFLVDRIELENQALKSFSGYLKNDYRTVIYKQHPDDWRKAEIVVSTVQTLLSNNRYKRIFRPTDFDLIISDEAHRSINGNSRAVFEYFLGYKLGLTATPKNYIKNVNAEKMKADDPRAWERRQLLDTYKTFGCESGEPTFTYSLIDGVNDPDGPYLINPITVDARTEITTQLLSDKGYAVVVKEEDEEAEEQFFARHFEKTFFSDETNRAFCKTFLENSLKDPITGEIGKSIVFAVSRKHASKLVQILNEFADSIYPDKYNSDFALQITSEIPNVQSYTINFQNNNLNGWSNFLENYKTSKTRVCVTVGMMTTGYDCQDLLNVVLMRPIFSPTDFVQIKGRGTRMFDFEFERKLNGFDEKHKKPKENFKLFDFFGNCEYFEEKYDYDQTSELPRKSKSNGPIDGLPPFDIDSYENLNPDPMKFVHETAIGSEGMKIDRKLFEKFEEKIQEDEFVKEKYEQDDLAAVMKYLKDNIFDKPKDYYNLEKLRRSINVDRKISLKEILDKIFGAIPHFKSKRELIEEEFERYLQLNEVNPDKFYDIKTFFETFISDKDTRRIIEDRKFQLLATNIAYTTNDLRSLGIENMNSIVEYIQDNININQFAY